MDYVLYFFASQKDFARNKYCRQAFRVNAASALDAVQFALYGCSDADCQGLTDDYAVKVYAGEPSHLVFESLISHVRR